MTRRFDRFDDGGKLHMQSLAALAHLDFNVAQAYSYEQAFDVARRLDIPLGSIEQQFRRMIFNVVARNQDDHVKNMAFLMNKEGEWALSPAYDVTHSYNSGGAWTARHQMTINGKADNFVLEDFRACAKVAGLKRSRDAEILKEVTDVVKNWPTYADGVKVPTTMRDRIASTLRLTYSIFKRSRTTSKGPGRSGGTAHSRKAPSGKK